MKIRYSVPTWIPAFAGMTVVLLSSFPTHAEDMPVVVELFTSQGCSACPPADRLFANLLDEYGDENILALSMHVDYWDRKGWKDPFSLPEATARQVNYENAMGTTRLFTPQIMINGEWSFAGTRSHDINEAIRDARGKHSPALPLTLEKTASGMKIGVAGDDAMEGPADIWFVSYDDRERTTIRRGENWGLVAQSRHNVRQLLYLGQWQDKPVSVALDFVPDTEFAAVLVQQPHGGKIIGARSLRLR